MDESDSFCAYRPTSLQCKMPASRRRNFPKEITCFPLATLMVYVLIFAICLSLARGVRAQDAAPTAVDQQAAISAAIQQLGNPDPAKRANARAKLVEFGSLAIPLLDAASRFETTDDHEVQWQAERIAADIRNLETQELSSDFADGQSQLSGWTEFKVVSEDSPLARELYQSIYLKHRQQITQIVNTPEELTFLELNRLLSSSEHEQVALGLFAAIRTLTDTDKKPVLKLQPRQLAALSRNLIGKQNQPFVAGQRYGVPLIKLACSFLKSVTKLPASQKLAVLKTIEHPYVDTCLIELLDRQHPPIVRALAVANLSKSPSATVVDQLKRYFDDTTTVGTFLADIAKNTNEPRRSSDAGDSDSPSTARLKKSTPIEVQIRDLCLLAVLKSEGKTPADYGFDPKSTSNARPKIDIRLAGFANNSEREQAFKSYQDN